MAMLRRVTHHKHSPKMRRSLPGTSPGMVLIDPAASRPTVRITAYGPDGVAERMVTDVGQVCEFLGVWPVVWVDVAGLGDADTIMRLGQLFKLHPLAIEDITSRPQRTKVDVYDERLFMSVKMMRLEEGLVGDQLSLFLGPNFVLTFSERPTLFRDRIRERISKGMDRIRKLGPDFLAYSLLDGVVDVFYPLLEQLGERLEDLQDKIMLEPNREMVNEIHDIRHDFLSLRRAVWPLREAVNTLLRELEDIPHFTRETRIYLRDCYDHAVEILDLVEMYRELTSDLMDMYMTSVSNRMNEVMKVLTIIATIFMPLSFVTGLYGMNFDTDSPWNMPELKWHYGYPYALCLMFTIAVVLMFSFWRMGWLSSDRPSRIPSRDDGNDAPVSPGLRAATTEAGSLPGVSESAAASHLPK